MCPTELTLRLCLVLLLAVQTSLAHHDHHKGAAASRGGERTSQIDKLLKRNTDVVDMMLGFLNEYVKLKNLKRLPFPTVQKTFNIKILGISSSVTIKGERGWAEDLSTLTRVGNVTATDLGQGKFSFATPLSLKKLSVGFDRYTLPIGKINLRGKINIKVDRNKIILKTMIVVDKGRDVCSFSIQGINLATFEGFDASMTGLGIRFNWMLDLIIEGILKNSRQIVRTQIEDQFSSIAKKFLVSVSCSLLSLV